MPEPDPQPKPRAVSPARKLLMLLPSVPMLLAVPIADAWSRAHNVQGESAIGPALGALFITFAVSAVLSIALGVRLEKWNRGSIQSLPRVTMYALNILFTASFVAWAGCAVVSKFSTK